MPTNNNKLHRKLLPGVLAGVLFVMSASSVAQMDGTVSGDKATDMVVDVVVVRPLGLAATIVGTVLTVVALPFTIPSGSVETSARELIVKPAEYTFQRPLGDFSGNAD
jgi:hypothetical protein